MEAQSANVAETLASLSLFGDLSYPELEAVAHTFDEEAFAKDQRVLRQDVSGGSFYVILSGEARVVIDIKPRGDRSVVRIQEEAVAGPGRFVPDAIMDVLLHWRNSETLHRLAYLAEGIASGTPGETTAEQEIGADAGSS